jgi:hypothetical protein
MVLCGDTLPHFQKIPKKLNPIWQVRAVTVLDKIRWMEPD